MLLLLMQSVTAKLSKLRRRDWLFLAYSLIVAFTVLAVTLLFPFNAADLRALSYIGVGVVNLMAASALYSFIPAALVTFRAAEFLNPIAIILISATAATLGETTKYFFGESMERLLGDYRWHKLLAKLFLKFPLILIALWIASPIPGKWLMEVFVGSTKYPIYKYMLATFMGNIVLFIWVVALGRFYLGV